LNQAPVAALEPRTANGDTRERILDAAESLFLDHGFEGTSMRMITAQAEVNLAAANYHFGSKEALIQEVFRRRLYWLNRERLRALEAMEREAGGAPLKPSQIVEAFFGTALRLAADTRHGGMRFMRLLGRTYTDPTQFVRTFLAAEYADVVERFSAALFRALPDVPRDEILWRFHFMLGAMAYALAGTDALQIIAGKVADDDPAAIAPRLMSFLLGGLRAPLPEKKVKKNAARARGAGPRAKGRSAA
jgi:AcrR family transcriptional regulator